ncbi:MAG: DNA gyrase C-terminal beta-propeller domain-containing protein, partial [Parasphingorhabdus sp.]|uniref:DNA gyrase C-terminal beta-propeller domain-containing protein n=1 Tax=Parasphingorhabdus sp. TaxID=2709688 RepID=UPI003297F6C8
EAMIDREPITVVCSQMGWVRAMTGHIDLGRELKFKDGDGPRFAFHAETTDRLLIFGANGRFYTLSAANLPGGRGMGEPVRLMVDLPNEVEIVDLFIHRPEGRLIVASTAGNGFVVAEKEIVAQTRAGKQSLNVKPDERAVICHPVVGDHVAIVSQNGKFLVFPVTELPELSRGKGVRLQKYNMARGRQGALELDGGLADLTTFEWSEGLKWEMGGGKTRHETGLTEWLGKRASVGKKAPFGFPRDHKFT